MTEYFIALIPEKKLYDKILKTKQAIFEKIGNQKYLLDHPHLTLSVGNTDRFEEILGAVETFSKANSTISVNIIDMLIFPKDPVTGNTNIGMKFDDDSITQLRKFQVSLLKNVYIYNSEKKAQRYKKISGLTASQKKDFEKYDYPYVGNGWIPHFSFGNIKSELAASALDCIDAKSFFDKYSLVSVELCILENDEPGKRYAFNLKK